MAMDHTGVALMGAGLCGALAACPRHLACASSVLWGPGGPSHWPEDLQWLTADSH